MRALLRNANAVKLVVFTVVTLLTTLLVGVTIGNVTVGAKAHYKAVFTDVTGILPGDDVRVAGVKVGRVTRASLEGRDAVLDLEVRKDVQLRDDAVARIRYRDLLGRRYVAISPGSGSVRADGSAFDKQHTQPALDLTVLFNGFRPIFSTLQPKDVNALASEIVATLQGEGGTVDSLLANTASLTNTLADRDAVVGRLVTNLNTVLGTVGQRDKALQQLISNLRRLATGLAQDRDVFAASLANIDTLSSATAGLLHDARPALDSDIASLNTVVKVVKDNKGVVNDALQRLPTTLETLTRATSYGSWLNLYLCDLRINVQGTLVDANNGGPNTARCQP